MAHEEGSRYDRSMSQEPPSEEALKNPQRTCSGCSQPIPSMSKLAIQQDGIDLCLQCQIRAAQITKGLRH